MTFEGSHSSLRHRKQSTSSSPAASGSTDAVETCEKEGPSNSKISSTSFDDQNRTRRSSQVVCTTNGYVLRPLLERSVLARLDVGPFLFLYVVLVSLDFVELPSLDSEHQVWITSLSFVTFPIVLMAHLGLFLVQQWSVHWRARVGYQLCSLSESREMSTQRWTHCLVEAPNVDKHHSSDDAAIVPIRMEGNVAVVNFQDIIFRYPFTDSAGSVENADITLWGNSEKGTPNHEFASSNIGIGFVRLRYPIHFPLSFYKSWKGFHSFQKVRSAQRVYGHNTTPIELPPFIDLLQEQVVAPFFLFQIFCVLLWSLDEYWYYALFTFFALLMFESTVAYNRLKSLERLRSYTMHHSRLIWVYRPAFPMGMNGWVQISVAEMVPGDVVSCKQITVRTSSFGRRSRVESAMLAQEQLKLNRVPADILILNGDAVVDESLLTGESVPQLKAALEVGGGDDCDDDKYDNPLDNSTKVSTSSDMLDLQEHKQFILFGGTTLLVSHPGGNPLLDIPIAPDQGAIGMVLRTGFETAQGSLLRTMAHTQKSVDGIHTRDTYVFIVLLLCCAVASAAMVWEEGWKDPTRNKFRLVLHVIIIVTSVVPPELPMELSLAVTNSVTDLIKRRIYCTEVFRLPLAGQVNICCFDKTGTLTSDEMQLQGVRLRAGIDSEEDGGGEQSFTHNLEPDSSIPWTARRIMVACHSLAIHAASQRISQRSDDDATVIGDPLEKVVLEATGYRLVQNNVLRKNEGTGEGPETILILQRFGFSSRLKRMSVLVSEASSNDIWVLTKGAPETLKQFIKPESLPCDYDEVSNHHMSLGQRVLAMAYRRLPDRGEIGTLNDVSRKDVEIDLIFAGFLLLHCPLKPDSKSIISELWGSGNRVVMITGDALLTAVEVARQVGIVRKVHKAYPPMYFLQHCSTATKDVGILSAFRFVPLTDKAKHDIHGELGLIKSELPKLKKLIEAREVALCISGDVLQQLVSNVVGSSSANGLSDQNLTDEKQILLHPAAQEVLKDVAPLISVFARHAPRQKEAIVAALNLAGLTTLMCGDGTNDVGALRRAHVGISIISAPEVEAKQRSATASIARMKAEHRKERKLSKGAKFDTNAKYSSKLESSLMKMQEAQDDLDQVELGDASIASPFTSRMVSIKCCKDVLQQGRCTLVTMLQIYKILGVNCLVNATILSTLFLHGVKQGDRQLTILGVVVATLFFFVTRGKPLPVLAPVRPPTSVLCPQALLSISSQFAIHYSAMVVATEVALSFVDPFDPSMIPDGPFNPNTLNTCTFLISVLATVNTFAVNYRGEPFVEPLRMNKMLWRSLQICYCVLFACALEVFPPLNDLFQLAEFPETSGGKEIPWIADEGFSGDSSLPFLEGLHNVVRTTGFPLFMSGLMICDTVLAFTAQNLILSIFDS